jgi:sulfoxide reductase heme-binding subunit YedZ
VSVSSSRAGDTPSASSRRPAHTTLSGWKLTGVLVIAIEIFSVIAATAVGGTSGANLGIRITARTSAVLFLLAFTASSLYQLWPTNTTKSIRRNRRYLGVAFAGSLLIHAVFIVTTMFSTSRTLNPTSWIPLRTPSSSSISSRTASSSR